MSYKVTIEQTTSRQAPYQHEWKTLYDTLEEARAAGADNRYGYATPPGEHTVYDKAVVFVQEVEELNVYAVIKAVNEAS